MIILSVLLLIGLMFGAAWLAERIYDYFWINRRMYQNQAEVATLITLIILVAIIIQIVVWVQ
jgi:hypothetical protein